MDYTAIYGIDIWKVMTNWKVSWLPGVHLLLPDRSGFAIEQRSQKWCRLMDYVKFCSYSGFVCHHGKLSIIEHIPAI